MKHEPNLDKPFSLEGYAAGKEFCTRGGCKVEKLIIFHSADTYPVAGVLSGVVVTWRITGQWGGNDGSEMDLFEVKE